MGDKLEFRRDVGVVVNGRATFKGPVTETLPPPVYIDEAEFYKATEMRASAPARVALLRLLHEDVTAKALSRIWRDELDFQEDHFTLRLDLWVPKFTACLLVALGACLIASVVLAKAGEAVMFLVMFATIALGASFMWSLINLYIPHHIAARIEPMIVRVNEELPDILSQWKKGLSPK